ncbi:UDP-N-acetylmuramate dehydrogenase [Zhaonella formicivorans]|jgi:UDP-N-acetylmuramate dehydrogenase|uniref:UDP-N-acetylmuramate dehydrogenase n=1 Tax=Zhaonella formicivorans TaxID=2528593 RepID=UPI001D0FCA37|nr:UDP-N-acetylmuramate dehydrogenase [Zhaonella formicivorans]
MDWERIAEFLKQKLKGQCRLNEPLQYHTTWRIGGPADLLVIPFCKDDVLLTMQLAAAEGIPVYVIGNGSNLLVLDRGVRGMVLKLAGGLKGISQEGCVLKAEAGVLLPFLAHLAAKSGLSGLEMLAGIPGTIGGAIVMNAGAYGSSIGELVQSVEVCDYAGNTIKLQQEELEFGYRRSALKGRPAVVLEAELKLQPGKREYIEKIMQENMLSRKKSQPLHLPNAGSVFINPPGSAAGYLIEKAGAKGLRKGGAQVSEKHANFIVNVGNASARDVLELIEQVREMVYLAFGIELQTEIKLLGEEE